MRNSMFKWTSLLQEGPHSIMHEEEFFDAVDATLDKLDREEENKVIISHYNL